MSAQQQIELLAAYIMENVPKAPTGEDGRVADLEVQVEAILDDLKRLLAARDESDQSRIIEQLTKQNERWRKEYATRTRALADMSVRTRAAEAQLAKAEERIAELIKPVSVQRRQEWDISYDALLEKNKELRKENAALRAVALQLKEACELGWPTLLTYAVFILKGLG